MAASVMQKQFRGLATQARAPQRLRCVRAFATAAPAVDEKLNVKHQLLAAVAGTNRGVLLTSSQRDEVAAIVSRLEGHAAQGLTSAQVQEMLQGRWQMVYSTVESFRSSPFFWAFQEGLVGDRQIANAIFAFTDAVPAARVGQAYQEFDFGASPSSSDASGSLVSEVDLEVGRLPLLPPASGCVVTTSSVRTGIPATQLMVTVESTRVARSNIAGFLLDQVVVPVKDIVERLRGAGSTTVAVQVTYIDEEMRVVRTPDDQIFVYRRV